MFRKGCLLYFLPAHCPHTAGSNVIDHVDCCPGLLTHKLASPNSSGTQLSHSTSRIMLVLHPKLQLILILIRVEAEVLLCPIIFLSSFPAIFSSSLPGAQHMDCLLPAIFSPHHSCGQLFHALVWLWSIFTRPIWSIKAWSSAQHSWAMEAPL